MIGTEILPEALESIEKKQLNIIKPFSHDQCVLSTIARLKKYKRELNFSIPNSLKYELLDLFNNQIKKNLLQFKSSDAEKY